MSKRVSKITQLLAVAAALEQAKPQQHRHTEMSVQAQFYLVTLLAFLDTAKANLEYLLVAEDAAPFIRQKIKQRMKAVDGAIDMLSDAIYGNMRLGDVGKFAETFLEFAHAATQSPQKCGEVCGLMRAYLDGKIIVHND